MRAGKAVAIAARAGAVGVVAIHLTDERLQKVYDLAQSTSKMSWENGTLGWTIIEREHPNLSVFGSSNPFPLPQPILMQEIPKLMNLAQVTMRNRPGPGNEYYGSLLEDGAAADPASLLMTIMIANNSVGDQQQFNGVTYRTAAAAQMNYTLNEVPRNAQGAISHRAEQFQFWSDFVFMVPPSLAFAAVVENNRTLLEESVRQCDLYRQGLRQSTGLWAHILQGTGVQDTGLWATGNAWAAYGMLRVWASIKYSPWAGDMGSQMSNLEDWVEEILSNSRAYITTNGMLRNYINQPGSFEDSTGTALIAAAALRMSTLRISNDYVNYGIDLLSAVSSRVNSTGHVNQVTDPFSFDKQGDMSPEAQSFVVLAYNAYQDWDSQGRQGANGADLGRNSWGTRGVTLEGGMGWGIGLAGGVAMMGMSML